MRVAAYQWIYYILGLEFWSLKAWSKWMFAKFIFKYCNNMLPNSFNNYFIKLENICNNIGYYCRQKRRNEYLQTSFGTETEKKHCITSVWTHGKVFWKNIVNVLSQNYYIPVITIDQRCAQLPEISGHHFVILLTFHCHFCRYFLLHLLYFSCLWTTIHTIAYIYFKVTNVFP